MFDYYIDTLEEYLRDFLNRNDIDCDICLGKDFAYLPMSNTIAYSLMVTDSSSDSFLTFVKKLFPEINADIFLWSFLHEIGHYETTDDFDEYEYEEYYFLINQEGLSNEFYYNLPIECAATIWAGEFMKNNTAEVQRLWNNIQPVIQAFFEKGERYGFI